MTGPSWGRSALERGLRTYWSGGGSPVGRALIGLATTPAAALYGTGVRLRNLAHDRGWLPTDAPPLPVVSVGNLAVGGTGKTPFTGWLTGHLVARGERPAVVSRGYGEDELLLHRRWHPTVPVVESPRRIDGVRIAAEQDCTIVVVDDGFQHRRLSRGLDIVLFSPAHPLPARLLPRGPYREPLGGLGRADLVLVTTKSGDERRGAERMLHDLRTRRPSGAVELLHLTPGPWAGLDGDPIVPPRQPALAVASVAQPDGFLALARERLGVAEATDGVELLSFPDHHPYTRSDLETILERAGDRPVVTTEKDAVKLTRMLSGTEEYTSMARSRFAVLPLHAAPGRRVVRRLDALLDRLRPTARGT